MFLLLGPHILPERFGVTGFESSVKIVCKKLVSALSRLHFISFSIALKLSQFPFKPDFLAFENRLPFFLTCLFNSVLIHGRLYLEPVSLEGMSVVKSPS